MSELSCDTPFIGRNETLDLSCYHCTIHVSNLMEYTDYRALKVYSRLPTRFVDKFTLK